MKGMPADEYPVPAGPLVAYLDVHMPTWRSGRNLGVSGTQRARWLRPDSFLMSRTADRIAVTVLGVHPIEVWGDAWWEAVA